MLCITVMGYGDTEFKSTPTQHKASKGVANLLTFAVYRKICFILSSFAMLYHTFGIAFCCPLTPAIAFTYHRIEIFLTF
jgi:hypothetical protein